MIAYEEVSLHFDGKTVFDSFSLEVAEGEKVLVYGKSGRGKSSLLLMLMGLLAPSGGRVSFRNTEVDSRSAWEVRRELAYVPQNPDLGEGRVSDLIGNIFSLKSNHQHNPPERDIGSLCDRFFLDIALLDKNFEELSGGEKQRLAIIIALLLGRNIFLLDEVTSALDPAAKQEVIDYFLANPQWTILAISHDREWREAPFSRVVSL